MINIKTNLVNFFDPISKMVDSIMQTTSSLLELKKNETKGYLND